MHYHNLVNENRARGKEPCGDGDDVYACQPWDDDESSHSVVVLDFSEDGHNRRCRAGVYAAALGAILLLLVLVLFVVTDGEPLAPTKPHSSNATAAANGTQSCTACAAAGGWYCAVSRECWPEPRCGGKCGGACVPARTVAACRPPSAVPPPPPFRMSSAVLPHRK